MAYVEARVKMRCAVVHHAVLMEPPSADGPGHAVDFEDATMSPAIRTDAHSDIARRFDATVRLAIHVLVSVHTLHDHQIAKEYRTLAIHPEKHGQKLSAVEPF